jgi:hypothetical protein
MLYGPTSIKVAVKIWSLHNFKVFATELRALAAC